MGFRDSPDPVTEADPKARLAALVSQAVRAAFPGAGETPVDLDRPKNADHGDFATNVALQLAKRVGMKPRDAALAIVAALGNAPEIAKTDIAGPGFINFTLSKASRFGVVPAIQAEGPDFGRGRSGEGRTIMVEFVSANPTGPLHVATDAGPRSATRSPRSSMAALEGAAGVLLQRRRQPDRQPRALASSSASARRRASAPGGMHDDWYRGDYIKDIARDYVAEYDEGRGRRRPEAIRRFAVAYLRGEQDAGPRAFGVKFDSYYLESSLYGDGVVDER